MWREHTTSAVEEQLALESSDHQGRACMGAGRSAMGRTSAGWEEQRARQPWNMGLGWAKSKQGPGHAQGAPRRATRELEAELELKRAPTMEEGKGRSRSRNGARHEWSSKSGARRDFRRRKPSASQGDEGTGRT